MFGMTTPAPVRCLSLLFPAIAFAAAEEIEFDLRYDVRVKEDSPIAEVAMTLAMEDSLIESFRFRVDPARQKGFAGDGRIEEGDPFVFWYPPEEGGRLEWKVDLIHKRNASGHDSWVGEDWAVFRGDDLVPAAQTEMPDNAQADAELHFDLPEGWSEVTRFRRSRGGSYAIRTERQFDRPTGWMAIGRIGVRRERIAGIPFAVAAPVGEGFRRMDVLAFLNWTVPELKRVFPDFESRMLIVGAGDPMWRGGLSGPFSLFLHSDRPLIGEDATSPILHELTHCAMSIRGETGNDWIVEGFAEYYSLEVMRRTGTITANRHEIAMEDLRKRGAKVDNLFVKRSSGAVTARAVTALAAVDRELRKRTSGSKDLDDLARVIVGDGDLTYARLVEEAERLAGGPLVSLAPENLPGALEAED